jgi:hypothetical protein
MKPLYAFVTLLALAVTILSCGKTEKQINKESQEFAASESGAAGRAASAKAGAAMRAGKAAKAAAGRGVLGVAGSSGQYAAVDFGESGANLDEILGQIGGIGESHVPVKYVSQAMIKARMIIKTADLSFEVEKYDTANIRIQKITEQFGGFISSANTEIPQENVKRGTVTLRVPSEKFEAILIELKKLAKKLESEGVRGEDVTEEFYDVEARLGNAKKTEGQYLDILRTAHTVTDVLAVQRELNAIRDQIDRFEGRRKFLMDQTGLSTITITFHDPYPVSISSSGGFWATIGEGFENGYKGFAVVLSGVIAFLIAGLPIFAFFGLILYGSIKWYRRRRTKKIAATNTEK